MIRAPASYGAFPDPRHAPLSPSPRMKAASIGVRPATAADIPFLQTLYGSLRQDGPGLAMLPPADRARFLDSQFRLQHRHFVTAAPEGDFLIVLRARPPLAAAPIGRLYLDRAGPVWRLTEIGIAPEARGGGTGSALIAWLQGEARLARATGIDLHVASDNVRAAALYRRLGFAQAPGGTATHARMFWRAGAVS